MAVNDADNQRQSLIVPVDGIIMQAPPDPETSEGALYFIYENLIHNERVPYKSNNHFFKYLKEKEKVKAVKGRLNIDFSGILGAVYSPDVIHHLKTPGSPESAAAVIPRYPRKPMLQSEGICMEMPGWLIRLDLDHTYFFAFDFMKLLFPVSKANQELARYQLDHNHLLEAVYFPVPICSPSPPSQSQAEPNTLLQAVYSEIPIDETEPPCIPMGLGTCAVVTSK